MEAGNLNLGDPRVAKAVVEAMRRVFASEFQKVLSNSHETIKLETEIIARVAETTSADEVPVYLRDTGQPVKIKNPRALTLVENDLVVVRLPNFRLDAMSYIDRNLSR